jgi:lysine-specific demethylase 8
LSVKQFPGLASDTEFDALLPPGIRNRTLYLWLGSGGTRSGLHFDRFDNMNAQIYGRKSVFLVSPEQNVNLYPFGDNVEKSQVDPDHPDFDCFPRFANVRPLTAIMEPGEMLFIPRLWWHHLHSLEPAINVNCWYGEHIPLHSLLRVIRQNGASCWAQVIKDFVTCGILGREAKARLFSEPPTGKVLYQILAGSVKRRLPNL